MSQGPGVARWLGGCLLTMGVLALLALIVFIIIPYGQAHNWGH